MYLTTGIHSEKCIVRRLCNGVSITEQTYTHLDGRACTTDGTAYHSGCKPALHITVQNDMRLNQAQEKTMP